MSDQSKEKRCLYCKKLLVDEKIPLCPRCKLEGRNTGAKGLAVLASLGFAFVKGKEMIDDYKA